MTDKELMQQALEALEEIADEVFSPYDSKLGEVILALRERLAQPRQWQNIPDNTLEELLGLHCSTSGYMSEADAREFATDLGSRLKERNT
jgi:hypothetical protein